ncbi:MAG: GDSL-type esterase/lipase family protein [Sphingobium phenoxybenzoativorans]|uniref:Lipolytic enzyme n=1 Tax=Sphingobium phenoxybenzoativorans TaxID=1592790 RepID=A0A975Q2A8_9SPHN|nr:GDSL-type esterase/lipase family protein [Sphingobium phenoxybenzoativorans]QUT06491.1 lipolytic enzyme [Sphingobium phenoxybenzoativorans]
MRYFLTAMMLAIPAAAIGGVPAADGFARFAPEIEAFSRQQAAGRAADDDALFVGSSSIRLWNVARSFPDIDAVNRGFGGATTPDVLHYYPQVIAGCQPESVIVYVGENDIAAGRSPDLVAADVLTLLGKIRTDFPHARIAYLSMKHSPLREDLWARMAAVNAMVKARAMTGKSFDFLDVSKSLLTNDGLPDKQFYTVDGLHMNALGYARWTAIVDAYLDAAHSPVTGKLASS